MAILIDGYNLLHVTNVFSDAVGPGSVEKLHTAFLQFLSSALDPAELPHTTVVFDAKGRRAKSRRTFRFGDLTVHYASRDEDADTMLAELIAQHSSPRRLTVVSSDHQVQRAARRRRAKAMDSDIWYAELLRGRRDRERSRGGPSDQKPATPLSESDAAWWLSQFPPELLADLAQEPSSARTPPIPVAQPSSSDPPSPPTREILVADIPANPDATADPFPREYLEAVQREFASGALEKPPPKSRTRKAAKRPPQNR